MIQRLLALSAAAMLPLAFAPEASAATALKYYFNQAVAICQPALPAYDGLIRKRPKAVANEGTTTAFVSCALAHQSDQFNTVESFNVQFINRQATSVQVNCTLVDGVGDGTYSPAVAKSVTVQPGSRIGLTWRYTTDNGNTRYTVPALSCAVPASTEVVGVAYQALDEIGS